MTSHADFADLTAWIRVRWPGTRMWSESHTTDLYPDFADIPIGALRHVAGQWFDQGHPQPPKPPVLRSRAIEHAAKSTPPAECAHPVYSVEDADPGYRTATCVRCGHAWSAVAEQLLTVGERQTQTTGTEAGVDEW